MEQLELQPFTVNGLMAPADKVHQGLNNHPQNIFCWRVRNITFCPRHDQAEIFLRDSSLSGLWCRGGKIATNYPELWVSIKKYPIDTPKYYLVTIGCGIPNVCVINIQRKVFKFD